MLGEVTKIYDNGNFTINVNCEVDGYNISNCEVNVYKQFAKVDGEMKVGDLVDVYGSFKNHKYYSDGRTLSRIDMIADNRLGGIKIVRSFNN